MGTKERENVQLDSRFAPRQSLAGGAGLQPAGDGQPAACRPAHRDSHLHPHRAGGNQAHRAARCADLHAPAHRSRAASARIDPRALSGCDIFLDSDFPNAVGSLPVSAQTLSDIEKKACLYTFASGTLFAGIFTSLPGREAFENVRQFDAMTGGVIEPVPLGEIALFKVFAEENRVVLEVVLNGWYIVLDGAGLDRKHLLLLAELSLEPVWFDIDERIDHETRFPCPLPARAGGAGLQFGPSLRSIRFPIRAIRFIRFPIRSRHPLPHPLPHPFRHPLSTRAPSTPPEWRNAACSPIPISAPCWGRRPPTAFPKPK